MNIKGIVKAEKEARRFLKLIKLIERESKGRRSLGPSKETAALKRASMDLTRALAEMRKP